MPLQNIQLAHIDVQDRKAGKFTVTINSTDGNVIACLNCSSEADAIKLRDAIRFHSDGLRYVRDYTPRK
jgi:hypothetical protein